MLKVINVTLAAEWPTPLTSLLPTDTLPTFFHTYTLDIVLMLIQLQAFVNSVSGSADHYYHACGDGLRNNDITIK